MIIKEKERNEEEGCFSDFTRTVKGKEYKYKRLTITLGYDASTGKQIQKVFYGKNEQECLNKKDIYFQNEGVTSRKSLFDRYELIGLILKSYGIKNVNFENMVYFDKKVKEIIKNI